MDDILYGLLVVVVMLAMFTDKKSYKIRNGYLVFGSISGFIINGLHLGLQGLWTSFLGFIFPILILFLLFALRMLGAGDIKLFATIGALMGPYFVMSVMLYAFVIGGIMAFFILFKKRLILQRIKYFFDYVIHGVYLRKWRPYYDSHLEGQMYIMHFSYAIGLGVLIQIVQTLSS